MDSVTSITPEGGGKIVIYKSPDGRTDLQLIARGETVWMTQKQLGDLFQTSKQNISLHIKNIFQEGELEEVSVVKEYLTTASDGKKYPTLFYNLDVILSVGYRVNSQIGTQFRQWATDILKDYVVKGFAMDDARLSGDKKGYFEELYNRVRTIRTSEHNFYEKIKEIFKITSSDYDSHSDMARQFFATIQNMFHYAIHQHTAAELVAERSDANKPKMGMTNWLNSENISAADALIAKNYLSEFELKQMQLLSEGFLAFAELKALEQTQMFMRTWAEKFISFLKLHDRPILLDKGKVSSDKAKEIAMKQYAIYEKAKKLEAQKLEDYLKNQEELTEPEVTTELDKPLKGLLSVPPRSKEKE